MGEAASIGLSDGSEMSVKYKINYKDMLEACPAFRDAMRKDFFADICYAAHQMGVRLA